MIKRETRLRSKNSYVLDRSTWDSHMVYGLWYKGDKVSYGYLTYVCGDTLDDAMKKWDNRYGGTALTTLEGNDFWCHDSDWETIVELHDKLVAVQHGPSSEYVGWWVAS